MTGNWTKMIKMKSGTYLCAWSGPASPEGRLDGCSTESFERLSSSLSVSNPSRSLNTRSSMFITSSLLDR
jgi:hypothetical protein